MPRRGRSGRVKLTLGEVIVLIAIIGIVTSMLVPANGPPPPRTDQDLDFGSWDPAAESAIQPPQDVVAADVNLAGKWMGKLHGRAWLAIEPDGSDAWHVTFRSGGRCGLSQHILLTRTATCKSGMLILDRPVQEISGTTYQRLYTARIHGREYLVPSARVEKLKQILKGGTPEEQASALEWEVLVRFEPDKDVNPSTAAD